VVSTDVTSRFSSLVELVCQVKPSLRAEDITLGARLVDDLGLDSLDLLQLSRKITRGMKVDFDLDAWDAGLSVHQGSVQSVLDHIGLIADTV
jgi:acyl carrier protein